MQEYSQILIVEPVDIIRQGLHAIFSSAFPDYTLRTMSVLKDLNYCTHKNDVVLILTNTALFVNNEEMLKRLREDFEKAKWMGIKSGFGNSSGEISFDQICNLDDSGEQLIKNAEHLLNIDRNSGSEHKDKLSDREIEVLKLIVKGFTNNQIAKNLYISIHTVNSHRKNIIQKLGIKSAAGLAMFAVVNNIVELSDYPEK